MTLTRPKNLLPLVRHLSFPTTPVLARAQMTPNLVTAMSLLLGLVAAWSFSFGNAQGDFTGALLFLGCYILDNCDGELARLTDRSSSVGQLFDTTVDWLVHTAMFVGLGLGSARAWDSDWFLWLGLVGALGTTINSVFALRRDWHAFKAGDEPVPEQQVEEPPPTSLRDRFIYVFRELSRADFCFVVMLCAGLNVLWLLVAFGALGAHVYWVTGFMRGAHKFHV